MKLINLLKQSLIEAETQAQPLRIEVEKISPNGTEVLKGVYYKVDTSKSSKVPKLIIKDNNNNEIASLFYEPGADKFFDGVEKDVEYKPVSRPAQAIFDSLKSETKF
jgi:hypothetical protein